ncbi:MAG TPA: cobalt ECF transporter T component CbiQ [Candidatus Hydromicrobium sp.]
MRYILDIRNKLIIILINIFLVVSVDNGEYIILGFYFLTAIMVVFLFRPELGLLIKRISVVFLYPFFISIFIPFLGGGKTVAKIDLKVFTLSITDNGITIFATVLIKSFISILLIASLLLSSDEMELLRGLRKIHFPRMIVSIIYLMYRYFFLIIEESKTGQMAIRSRVFRRTSYGIINKKLSHLMGNLFIKSFDRVENIYKSMESRGFDGNFYVIEKKNKTGALNIIMLLTFILIPLSLKTIELLNIL